MQFTQQCSWNLFKILGKQGIQKWLFLNEAPKNIYIYGQKMNNHYDNTPLTCRRVENKIMKKKRTHMKLEQQYKMYNALTIAA